MPRRSRFVVIGVFSLQAIVVVAALVGLILSQGTSAALIGIQLTKWLSLIQLLVISCLALTISVQRYAQTGTCTRLLFGSSPHQSVRHQNTWKPRWSSAEALEPRILLAADLFVEKSVNEVLPLPGDEVTFSVKVTNLGPDGATGVEIKDQLPAGLTLDLGSITSTQGTYDPGTGIWSVGALNNTAMATLTITAAVTPGEGDPSGTGAYIDDFVSSNSGGLVRPENLTFGPDGNLYVTSHDTNQILRYDGDTGAFIDEFVTADSGGLTTPHGIDFGPDGNLYVSSETSSDIFRYDGQTGASLGSFVTLSNDYNPGDIAFGPDGNLYVAQVCCASFNGPNPDNVLRYDGTTGAFIDEFVGPGVGGLEGPRGLAFGPDGDLYVSSFHNHKVVRFDGVTGGLVDDEFASGGGLDGPRDLTFGPDGNLYVSSMLSNSVLRFDGTTGGSLGVFAAGPSGPEGLTFGPDGHLYVASQYNRRVMRFDGFITNFASVNQLDQTDENPINNSSFAGVDYQAAEFGAYIDDFVSYNSGGLIRPENLTFGPDGHLYVASHDTNQILRYNGDTGAFLDEFVTADSGGLTTPHGIAFGADGHLYVSSETSSNIFRYDGQSGAFLGIFLTLSNDYNPGDIAFGPDGHLYVGQVCCASINGPNSDDVLRFDGATGEFIDEFVGFREGGLEGPRGLTFGPDGNLYVSSFHNHKVLRYDGVTGAFMDEFATGGGLKGPRDLTFGPDGNLYVSSMLSNNVLRFDGTTGDALGVFATAPKLAGPEGLTFGPDGHLYVASQYQRRVMRFNGFIVAVTPQLLWHNPLNSLDVNGDGAVTPIDALLIINELNEHGARELSASNAPSFDIDTNGDNHVAPNDVLLIINHLNAPHVAEGEAVNVSFVQRSQHDAAASQIPTTPSQRTRGSIPSVNDDDSREFAWTRDVVVAERQRPPRVDSDFSRTVDRVMEEWFAEDQILLLDDLAEQE